MKSIWCIIFISWTVVTSISNSGLSPSIQHTALTSKANDTAHDGEKQRSVLFQRRLDSSCTAAICRNVRDQRIPCSLSLSRCKSVDETTSRPITCSTGIAFNLYLTTDQYGGETFFKLKGNTGRVNKVGPMEFQDNTSFHINGCLPFGPGVCYNFTMADTGHDGMCCGYTKDGAYSGYKLMIDGQTVKTGGAFSYLESIFFGDCPSVATIGEYPSTPASSPASNPGVSPVTPPVATSNPTMPPTAKVVTATTMPPTTAKPTMTPTPKAVVPSASALSLVPPTASPFTAYLKCNAPTDCDTSCCFNTTINGCQCVPSSSAYCSQTPPNPNACGNPTTTLSDPAVLQSSSPVSEASTLVDTNNTYEGSAVDSAETQNKDEGNTSSKPSSTTAYCSSAALVEDNEALPDALQLVPTEIFYQYYLIVASDAKVTADEVRTEVLPSLERKMLASMQNACSGIAPSDKLGNRRRLTEHKRKGDKTAKHSNRRRLKTDDVIAIQSGPTDVVDVNGE